MRNNFLSILFLSLTCVINSNAKQVDTSIIDFNLTKDSETPLSDAIYGVEIIQLKSNNMILHDINSIYTNSRHIVIKDRIFNNQYIYNTNGEYIADLGNTLYPDKQYIAQSTVMYAHRKWKEYIYCSLYPRYESLIIDAKKWNITKQKIDDVSDDYIPINDGYNKSITKKRIAIHKPGNDSITIVNTKSNKQVLSYILNFITKDDEGVYIDRAFLYKDYIIVKYELFEYIKAADIKILKDNYYALYNTKNGKSIAQLTPKNNIQGSSLELIGVCNDGFVFYTTDPWNSTYSDTFKGKLSEQGLETIDSINEKSDYLLFILKPSITKDK